MILLNSPFSEYASIAVVWKLLTQATNTELFIKVLFSYYDTQACYAPEAAVQIGASVSPDDGGGMEGFRSTAEPGMGPLHDSQARYVVKVSVLGFWRN